MAHPGGRPTDYNDDIAARICEAISTSSKSVATLCKENSDFPAETNVFKWMMRYPEFRQGYLEAKELQSLLISEEIFDDARACPEVNESIAKANHVFRVAQWHLSKLAPKQFGDKKEAAVTLNVHESNLTNLK